MEWNWLTIAVAGVFLLGFLIGIYRGAIRIAVSLATTILTIVIVVAASPYVSSAIEKHTPIDDMIKSQVTNTMAKDRERRKSISGAVNAPKAITPSTG